MLYRTCSRVLLVALGVCAVLGACATAASETPEGIRPRHEDHESLNPPTSNSHSYKSHHSQPLLELNETEILQGHGSDPLSYWSHDFEKDNEESSKNWRLLMGLHVFGMSIAFFVLLPIAISLRSVRHQWHGAAYVAFYLVGLFSSAAGTLYKKLTGDLYQGSIHGRGGFLVLALASILAVCDALAFFQRLLAFLRRSDKRTIGLFWRSVVLDQPQESTPEYTRLVQDEADDYDHAALHHPQDGTDPSPVDNNPGSIDVSRERSSEWVNQEDWPQSITSNRILGGYTHQSRGHSITSEETLHAPSPFFISETRDNDDLHGLPLLSRIRRLVIATAERVLVILAFVQLLSGITVYTGICRQNYINGCMAHLIKGGIFWCYGLLTFGRYLGAWADLGWAWNRLPARRTQSIPSAETVESLVIFLYGVTNVWMERFGAAPGSPFTTKQLQHISIAAMFWFAGMLGLSLESRALRRWLSASARSAVKPEQQLPPPPSYAGSFNPFPALVIGVTGAAMSAHHQTYLFQMQIHGLWGFFLTSFAVLRCLTYFFLWLRPPHTVLPSRPPTEAMASFFLACGGLVFILSTEQISFAAMRRQMDDVMLFFNLAVAATCLAFCWVMAITGFKGWVAYRMRSSFPRPLTQKVLFGEHES